MGWEFAAIWCEEPDGSWSWIWRRVADDNGDLLATSSPYAALEDCIEDARKHGFDDGDCPTA